MWFFDRCGLGLWVLPRVRCERPRLSGTAQFSAQWRDFILNAKISHFGTSSGWLMPGKKAVGRNRSKGSAKEKLATEGKQTKCWGEAKSQQELRHGECARWLGLQGWNIAQSSWGLPAGPSCFLTLCDTFKTNLKPLKVTSGVLCFVTCKQRQKYSRQKSWLRGMLKIDNIYVLVGRKRGRGRARRDFKRIKTLHSKIICT